MDLRTPDQREQWAGPVTQDERPGGDHAYPPPGWPSKDQIVYTKEAITTLFLLVAVPVVLLQLLRRPASAARGIAGKAAGV